jgi:hypothetical protein
LMLWLRCAPPLMFLRFAICDAEVMSKKGGREVASSNDPL